mgnify:CR=1 FL=1
MNLFYVERNESMTNKEYADFLLPNVEHDMDYYEKKYPYRDLKEGAIVTRYAPSPTGFVHMGALYAAFIERKMARQTDGVFFLRIEDTDKKREVENGIESIVRDLNNFGITFDEGVVNETEEKGIYGPYIQSKRKDIYQAFAKYLIEQDLAYPAFETEGELKEIREHQELVKDRIGYYGDYAKSRFFTKEEAVEKIKNGAPYIIRLKSPGDFNKKIVLNDAIKGKIEMPENDMDIVIIKSDGLPTYHFAHLVDDHLMRTTHVIRGDEWVSSVPIHLQLFQVFGFKAPKYAHISPLMKEENGARRKLSKRKDPEMAVSYYHEKGIPNEAILLYLATVANSNFEGWLDANPTGKIDDFKMDFKKISPSGSLFDLEKILNLSKNFISRLKAEEVYERGLAWAEEYDSEFADLLKKYKEYSIGIFDIERNKKKPRKDYTCFSDLKNQIWYMYDELYHPNKEDFEYQNINDPKEIETILSTYMEKYYSEEEDEQTWFEHMKDLASELGYAREVKEYKNNPDQYKGHIGDISMVLRVALTTKSMTPNLYDIMKLFGHDRMMQRYGLKK